MSLKLRVGDQKLRRKINKYLVYNQINPMIDLIELITFKLMGKSTHHRFYLFSVEIPSNIRGR